MGEFIGFVIGIGMVIMFIFRLFAKRGGATKETGAQHNAALHSGKLSSKDTLKTDDHTSY